MYKETCCANSAISSSLALVTTSLSNIERSHMPSRQYLKRNKSDIGFFASAILLKAEFLASTLSESDGVLSVLSRFSNLPSEFLVNAFPSYISVEQVKHQ